MASDPRTTLATNCEDCGLLSAGVTDPATVLRRLPAALWNHARPTVESLPALTGGDTVFDSTPFGPIAGDETLQWNLARILAQEKDRFRADWALAEAEQLAIGTVEVRDGSLVTECHHAAGRDLDRLGEQYGVGRPSGFTDCCYWRLVVLMLFQPAATTWRVVELAHLFTGLRPGVTEDVRLLTLTWPEALGAGDSSFDDAAYFDDNGALGGPSTSVDDLEGFLDWDGYWLPSASNHVGFDLHLAIDRAKPAGTFVHYINEPLNGSSGCKGSTTRAAAEAIRGHW